MGILPPTQTNRVPPQPATMGDFADKPALDMLDGDAYGRTTDNTTLRRIPLKLLVLVSLFWALVIAGVVIVWAAR